MPHPFSIDRETGDIRIREIATLRGSVLKTEVSAQVGDLVEGARDHGNGYEWMYLGGLTFGGRPAHLALCFHTSRLQQASWSVRLPDASMEGGWPTRDAIDQEIAFVHRTLTDEMGLDPGPQSWGEIWSSFDAKAFMASNGLRYHGV